MAMPIRGAFLVGEANSEPAPCWRWKRSRWRLGQAADRRLADYQPAKQDVTPRTQAGLRFNEHVFFTLAEAGETIEAWRHDYNHLRPHGSLGALTRPRSRHSKDRNINRPRRAK